jgi:hypothetical protein
MSGKNLLAMPRAVVQVQLAELQQIGGSEPQSKGAHRNALRVSTPTEAGIDELCRGGIEKRLAVCRSGIDLQRVEKSFTGIIQDRPRVVSVSALKSRC